MAIENVGNAWEHDLPDAEGYPSLVPVPAEASEHPALAGDPSLRFYMSRGYWPCDCPARCTCKGAPTAASLTADKAPVVAVGSASRELA